MPLWISFFRKSVHNATIAIIVRQQMWRAVIEFAPVWSIQRAFDHGHLAVFDPYRRVVAI
jgi:hypothetical protein